MMHPSFFDNSDTFTSSPGPRPPPYVSSTDGTPASPAAVGGGLEAEPPPAYPVSTPHVQVSNTAMIFTTGNSRPVLRNLMIHTVHPDSQVQGTYPGFAFCRFTPGKIETLIRSSIAVKEKLFLYHCWKRC